jgi:hypothetical protein
MMSPAFIKIGTAAGSLAGDLDEHRIADGKKIPPTDELHHLQQIGMSDQPLASLALARDEIDS